MFDVVIIGGGVTGCVLARELTKYQLDVCVLEKTNDVAGGASKANSGIVHGGYDPEPNTLKAEMNIAGVPLLYELAKELNVPCKQNGSMIVAFGKEQEPAIYELYERGIVNGVKGMSILTGEQARELEPNLSTEVSKALLVPSAGIICPYELTIASMGNAMDNGATLQRNFEVVKIEKGETYRVYSSVGNVVEGKYVVNCAGAYSDSVAKMVGDDFFEIIPRAGEYLLLDKLEGNRVKHTIFQVPTKEGKGILVTPTVDNNLLTGPTASKVKNAEFKDTTSDGLDIVQRLALKSVPSVNFRQVITSFSGVRASEKNGDFIITASKNNKGFVHCGAIDSPGLTSCVAIAKKVISILNEEGLELKINEKFNGNRKDPHAFKKMTDEQKSEFIKANPAYGKIVCRCETVSEGEIIDAIRRNPKALDVDGVKRRTRSGMGRCQGGFCLPYVMKLLAQENGVEIDSVTKKGKGSNYTDGEL